MNWSHALLVVSGACTFALFAIFMGFAAGIIKELPVVIPLYLFLVATIGGALAAGLWR